MIPDFGDKDFFSTGEWIRICKIMVNAVVAVSDQIREHQGPAQNLATQDLNKAKTSFIEW